MSYETDRIEADITRSRHALNDTIEALGSKLSPGQIVDEVLGLAQGQAGVFVTKLGRQVRDNPLPTLLIAAGIGLLALNRGQQGQSDADYDDLHADRQFRLLEEARRGVARGASETEAAFKERLHQAQAAALQLKQNAGEAMEAFRERVAQAINATEQAALAARERLSRTVSNAMHYAQDQAVHLKEKAADAKHSAEDFYQGNPLAAGAVALAVGAVIGGAAPLSSAERETLRGVANRAAAKGADLAERAARRVEEGVDSLH